jgi:hypothetical protein
MKTVPSGLALIAGLACSLSSLSGCGASSFTPAQQQPAASGGPAGVVAVPAQAQPIKLAPAQPVAPMPPPAGLTGSADSAPPPNFDELLRQGKLSPAEIERYRPAVAKAQAEKSKAESDRLQAALAKMQAELAEQLAALQKQMENEPTPEELAEDRKRHPASQIWLTLSNLSITKGELEEPVVSFDYRLVCGSPRKHGTYRLMVYVLGPNEQQISETTKVYDRFLDLENKEGGKIQHRLLGVIEPIDPKRVAVVVLRGIEGFRNLQNRQLSGFLTTDVASSDPTPPKLPADEIGPEAKGKLFVIKVPPRGTRPPLYTDLDVVLEFQVQAPDKVLGSCHLVVEDANRKKFTFDVEYLTDVAEPYTRCRMRVQDGPFEPSQAPSPPFRAHLERQDTSSNEWETASNTVTFE